MGIETIGMIGVSRPPEAATVHVIDGGVSPDHLVELRSATSSSPGSRPVPTSSTGPPA